MDNVLYGAQAYAATLAYPACLVAFKTWTGSGFNQRSLAVGANLEFDDLECLRTPLHRDAGEGC